MKYGNYPHNPGHEGKGIKTRVQLHAGGPMRECIEQTGRWAPAIYLGLFVVATCIIIWSLHLLERKGLQGTMLGILCAPFCSALGNLIFVQLMLQDPANGPLVLENVLLKNVTNLTVLLGLPALLWGMNVLDTAGAPPAKQKKSSRQVDMAGAVVRIQRLSLLLSLFAALFFSAAVWVLGQDGMLSRMDGLILLGLFAFWQVMHIWDVSKYAVAARFSMGPAILVDLGLLLVGGYLTYVSTAWLVGWVMILGQGFIGRDGLGWLSGWMMIIPNVLLVVYYAARGRADIAYGAQIGDGLICIPLCLGLFAVFHPVHMLGSSFTSLELILAAAFLHMTFLITLGRLPRWAGAALTLAYGLFVYRSLLG